MINGSIQQKKDNLYAVLRVKTAGGGYKTKWVSMGMKATAKKKDQRARLDELRLMYSEIASVEALEIYFCDFIKKWNEETKDSKSITTYDGYCHIIEKYVYPYFKDKALTLADLRPCDIDSYYRWLQRDCGLSGNTALKHHQIIHTSLKYAVYNRLLKDNPCSNVKRPKAIKPEHNFYNDEELQHLFKVVKGDALETVIYLTVVFGLRREEILGLRWANIDTQKHKLKICETVVRGKVDGKLISVARQKTKTETSNRVYYLSAEVEQYLSIVAERQNKQRLLCGDSYFQSDYVCTDLMGNPFKPDYVSHRWQKIVKKHELKPITFHDLRHSTGSYMHAKGYSMKEIQEFLGHSNYNFTADTYVHTDTATKQSMAATISTDLKMF